MIWSHWRPKGRPYFPDCTSRIVFFLSFCLDLANLPAVGYSNIELGYDLNTEGEYILMEPKRHSALRSYLRSHRLIEQLESRLLLSSTVLEIAGGPDAAPPAVAFAGQPDHLISSCQFAPAPFRFQLVENSDAPLALIMNAGATAFVQQGAWLQLDGNVLGHWQGQPLAVEWSKLSGPGNASFSEPLDVDAQVQFDVAGDYVLQLQAVADGVTVVGQLGVNVDVAAANVVNIDQAWLNAQGPGPYYLDQAGKTYRLQTDVTVEGTAFIVLNRDICFDLNGHTIVYGNSGPIVVQNGGFEQGNGENDIPGWTFSDPNQARRLAARAGFWGDWALELTGITSTSSQIATSQPIQIPLANVEYAALVTPKGPSSSKVNIAVIDTVTGQVLANADSANPDRGFSAVTRFTPTTTNPVQIRITASTSATGPLTVAMDYVTLTRSRDYGIVATPSSWNLPAHLLTPNVSANASRVENVTIENGTVLQGMGRSYAGNGMYLQSVKTSLAVNDMSITVNGTDSQHIFAQYAPNTIIHNNHLTGALDNISNRMRLLSGISLQSAEGTVVIEGNTIDGALHVPIIVTRGSSTNTNSIVINNNTIRHNSQYTDGYGIIVNNVRNFQITNNLITPVNGRGIILDSFSSGSTHNGLVANNHVESRERPNLEYGGAGIEATAFRIRNWGGDAFRNITIRDNLFFAETGIGGTWAATGARITFINENGIMNNHNVLFENNTFRAVLNAIDPQYTGGRSPRAWGLTFSTSQAGVNTIFRNNRFESNDVSLNFGDNDGYNGISSGVTLVGNTFKKLDVNGGPSLPHRSVAVGDWSTTVTSVRLIDNSYDNGATDVIDFIGSKLKDVSVGWLLNVRVTNSGGTAVVGASVSVFDRDNQSVFSGVTDSSGSLDRIPVVTTVFRQTTSNSETITTDLRGSFRLEVSMGAQSISQAFDLEDNLSLSVVLQ